MVALVLLDSATARALVAVFGLVLMAGMAAFVLRRQFAFIFDMLTEVDDDGLPVPVVEEDLPTFAPLAAAVLERQERGERAREILAELRATSERLTVTLEVATEGLFELHFEPGNPTVGEGRYFVSGMEFFGVPADQLVEQDIIELNSRVRSDHRFALQRLVLDQAHDDDRFAVDVPVQNVAGEWRWLSMRGRTLEAVDGQPVRVLAVLNDITNRRELERRAAHSDKMRSLGYLVTGLTHDLSNILSVVRANAELLLEFELPPEDTERLVSRTRDMADDGFALLQGLLGLAPVLDDGSVVRLGQLVSLVADSLRELAPSTVSIHVDVHDQAVHVRGDRARIDQVVLNLGMNAVDAVGEHGNVHISTTPVALGARNPHGLSAGEYVVLRVLDDGPGIDPAVLDTVFEPFVTTKPPGMGTGLGLATSLDTVSQAGGTMYAANNTDAPGATITVILPVAPSPEEQDPVFSDEQLLSQ